MVWSYKENKIVIKSSTLIKTSFTIPIAILMIFIIFWYIPLIKISQGLEIYTLILAGLLLVWTCLWLINSLLYEYEISYDKHTDEWIVKRPIISIFPFQYEKIRKKGILKELRAESLYYRRYKEEYLERLLPILIFSDGEEIEIAPREFRELLAPEINSWASLTKKEFLELGGKLKVKTVL